MSNVLILMIIPNKDYEEELNEREKLRFDVSPNKRGLCCVLNLFVNFLISVIHLYISSQDD